MSDMPGLLRVFLALDKRRKASGLSPTEMARWSQLKGALSRHFEPSIEEQHARSRESVRVPLDLNVNFESLGEIRKCMMKNLSAGGIFVATESPLPIGTPFNVHIRIEKTGEDIQLPGEVVSVGASADLSAEKHGMGIRFVNLSDSQREQVEKFSEQVMKNAIEGAEDPSPDDS
jgi:uncharacterized protein (TIGR02266 family)